MSNTRMLSHASRGVVSVLTLIALAACSAPETPLGAWKLADDVQIELYEDETFALFTASDEGFVHTYAGTYRYAPADGTLEFLRSGSPMLSWQGVAAGEGQLAYTHEGSVRTAQRAERVQAVERPSEPVAAIFGFDQDLTAQLRQMGGEVEEWWLGSSAYRWHAEGFDGARLYKAVDPSIGRPYVTVDWWGSANAAESLGRLFRAGVFQVGPEYEGPEPALFEATDIGDMGEGPGSGDATIIAFLDPPPGQDFSQLWADLRALVLAADGYSGHRLYERVSMGGGERIGVVEFESVEAARFVRSSPAFSRLIEAFGNPDKIGVFTPVAEDMAQGSATMR